MVNYNKILKSFFLLFLVFGVLFFTGCTKNAQDDTNGPVVDNAYEEQAADTNIAQNQEEIVIQNTTPVIADEEVFQDEFVNVDEDVEIGQLI